MHKTAAVYRDFDPECELMDHISSWYLVLMYLFTFDFEKRTEEAISL